METAQIITWVIALIAVFISFVSLYRTGKVQKGQIRLQTKQEELVTLQLDLLHEQVTQGKRLEQGLVSKQLEKAEKVEQSVIVPATAEAKGDVRVELEKYGGDYRFVITNWGRGSALNLTLDVKPKDGKGSPFVPDDYKEKIPIRELLPGGRMTIWAAITFGTGTVFDATWSWEHEDGSKVTRETVLSL